MVFALQMLSDKPYMGSVTSGPNAADTDGRGARGDRAVAADPSRGGALNASQTVDAQAAYESLMTLLATFLADANFVMLRPVG